LFFCPCGVRIERCMIVAHLRSGKSSYTDPMQSRLKVSVNRKVIAG
jgi:hypothetical protein